MTGYASSNIFKAFFDSFTFNKYFSGSLKLLVSRRFSTEFKFNSSPSSTEFFFQELIPLSHNLRCGRPHGGCREIVCGLKLYEDVDEVIFTNLTSAIKRVQESGSLVKLSFGGWQEYGNLKLSRKVQLSKSK